MLGVSAWLGFQLHQVFTRVQNAFHKTSSVVLIGFNCKILQCRVFVCKDSFLETSSSPVVTFEVTDHFKQLTGKVSEKKKSERIMDLESHNESKKCLAMKAAASSRHCTAAKIPGWGNCREWDFVFLHQCPNLHHCHLLHLHRDSSALHLHDVEENLNYCYPCSHYPSHACNTCLLMP